MSCGPLLSTAAGTRNAQENLLGILAKSVLKDHPPDTRKKYEQIITELVHQRGVTRHLEAKEVTSPTSFQWLYQLRYYWDPAQVDLVKQLGIRIANAHFDYGFEYLGVGDRLVHTALTDRCFLTLTQALHFRLGGNPFGPAGTGKTESVKALGSQLGRFTLVFNCDDTFDFTAMGRIFIGLCQVGAWGCFDEFNRLEERVLSAVSQQIFAIQQGLADNAKHIELMKRSVKLHPDVGIFVTMNPGYAGRSNLPDNLKQLFRGMAMVEPERELIAEVMLFSQGVNHAEVLAKKIVLLFRMCGDQLSVQPHYDWGLRALKSVLVTAGNLKRKKMTGELREVDKADLAEAELQMLIKAACDTIIPKLVSNDLPLFGSLLSSIFPGFAPTDVEDAHIRQCVVEVCKDLMLCPGEKWVAKVLQLREVLEIHHGVMMVGPSGTGKSTAWQVLLRALELFDHTKGVAHILDPKAISKDQLYGTLDPHTNEWSDGVFTHVLRNVVNDVKGDAAHKRHWIVFDGDVDPEWAENLNSVLDENRILTLPSGERIALPSNVRVMVEVSTLKYATLATVSRCGMVWFSEDTVSDAMMFDHYLQRLEGNRMSGSLYSLADDNGRPPPPPTTTTATTTTSATTVVATVRHEFAKAIRRLFQTKAEGVAVDITASAEDFLVSSCLEWSLGRGTTTTTTGEDSSTKGDGAATAGGKTWSQEGSSTPAEVHVMDPTRLQLIHSCFALIETGVLKVEEYNARQPEFPLNAPLLADFAVKHLLLSIVWGFGGSLPGSGRAQLYDHMRKVVVNVDLPHDSLPPSPSQALSSSSSSSALGAAAAAAAAPCLHDFYLSIENKVQWQAWSGKVPRVEFEPQKILSTDVVIPTVDTLRHEELVRGWLGTHQPLILCGPPGSGKTMTLTATLKSMPELELVSVNFSSSTTPDLVLKVFAQYCEFKKEADGRIVLQPRESRAMGQSDDAAVSFGLLGFWAFGLLGFWAFGLLGFWAFGLLGFWAFGLLGFGLWALGFGLCFWLCFWLFVFGFLFLSFCLFVFLSLSLSLSLSRSDLT
jgi:dynein heavy chain 1